MIKLKYQRFITPSELMDLGIAYEWLLISQKERQIMQAPYWRDPPPTRIYPCQRYYS